MEKGERRDSWNLAPGEEILTFELVSPDLDPMASDQKNVAYGRLKRQRRRRPNMMQGWFHSHRCHRRS
jgi:hypothetical protein